MSTYCKTMWQDDVMCTEIAAIESWVQRGLTPGHYSAKWLSRSVDGMVTMGLAWRG